MHTTRSAACVAFIGSLCTTAFAQSLQYQVQTYAPFPRYGPADSPHEWNPRGILPDGTLVINTFWEMPDPEVERSAVALVSPTSSTRLEGADGTQISHAYASAVEPNGRIHLSGRVTGIDDFSVTWQAGQIGRQVDALGISSHEVIDISTNGHVLARNLRDYPFRSTVIYQGSASLVPLLGDLPLFNWANAVNSSGQVLGTTIIGPDYFAFIASADGVTLLNFPQRLDFPWNMGTFGATDINDAGWAVGLFGLYNQTESLAETVVWRDGQRFSLPGGPTVLSSPQIDNLGTILSADDASQYLWRDGTLTRMTDLNLSGFTGTLLSIDRLEPDGRAIGQALVDGIRVPVVLTPIPAPNSVALVLAGVTIAATRRRRN